MTRWARWIGGILVLVAVACVGCSSPSRPARRAGGARVASASHEGLTRFYRQRLRWTPCGSFQCGTLLVPLNYADPGGRAIHVAVIRKPATDPSARIGALVMNPGGPGASGVQFLRQAAGAFPRAVQARFDLVSFDPRGVGASAPVECLSGDQLTAYLAANPVPTTPAQRAAAIALAKTFATGCRRHSAALLPFVGSVDVARDMDVLRAALGERRLNYLGFSYGTFLGAMYAQLFPRRIRAMVLDGALDPRLTSLRIAAVQADGFQRDLTDFLSWCVRRPTCPLGRTVASASRGLRRLQAAVLRHPLPAGAYGTLASGDFLAGLAAGLYDPATGWPDLLDGLRSAAAGDGVVLLVLADELEGHTPGGGWSNEIEANVAVNCIDRPNPRRVSDYAAAAALAARTAPFFGAANVWSDLVCAYWPVPAVTRPHPVHAAGAPPILVVGTTRDPATPYTWAKALAGQLRSGRLLTYVGDGHTAYLRSGCIDGYVDAYLISRSLPAVGATCS